MYSSCIEMLLAYLLMTALANCVAAFEDKHIYGDVSIDGTLKIYSRDNEWLTVCYSGFSPSAAHVVCRQNGFINATGLNYGDIEERTELVYTFVECPTVSNYVLYGETHILRCHVTEPVPFFDAGDCETISITCNTNTLIDHAPYQGQVFMNDPSTSTPSDGELQVYMNGWKYICYSDAFTSVVADSACRHYGYTGSADFSGVTVADQDSLMFYGYSCNTSSFSCFSHCISSSSYSIERCDKRVSLECVFTMANKSSQTSGSQNQCTLSNNKDTNGYEIATYTYTAIAGLLLITLLIVSLGYCIRRRRQQRRGAYGNLRAREDMELPNDKK